MLTQSSQNWFTVEFVILECRSLLFCSLDRRTTPSPSLCHCLSVPPHLRVYSFTFLGANKAASQNMKVFFSSVQRRPFSKAFYDSLAFLTLKHFFDVAVSTFLEKDIFLYLFAPLKSTFTGILLRLLHKAHSLHLTSSFMKETFEM